MKMLKNICAWLIVLIVWVPFSIISYICMLPIAWGVSRLLGATDMSWWEFTRGWFTGEWLQR